MNGRVHGNLLALAAAAGMALSAWPGRLPGQARTKPATNLDYWLSQARPTTSPSTPQAPEANPLGASDRFRRRDALPGVTILSDGTVIPGGVYTTRDKNWEVWVESEERWRHIPPILVLSIQAVVVEEAMDNEWRWKEMGSDEKVFTGRKKPIRRFRWRFHLIDDSHVTGNVKGQPVWIEVDRKTKGPHVLHERSAGKYGQTLADLVYVKRIVISRRAMEQARRARPASAPAK